jgi:hypothetical protein
MIRRHGDAIIDLLSKLATKNNTNRSARLKGKSPQDRNNDKGPQEGDGRRSTHTLEGEKTPFETSLERSHRAIAGNITVSFLISPCSPRYLSVFFGHYNILSQAAQPSPGHTNSLTLCLPHFQPSLSTHSARIRPVRHRHEPQPQHRQQRRAHEGQRRQRGYGHTKRVY